ncbi:hypothetical protein PACTADRAFT_73423 [Pachysolen tannophilus NRRL Y-2460]|uniref:Peroxisomal membrane protein 4 n=1 Tax=Pachysolen tannophilus NRRL Y-2460 TaxID=669874 RepID=A0A1E4U164_PACTA|nr:hypothetical protein PACTADRAFT_73423 [Pachysolen tannophilus NRRL Y-2460]
MDIEPIERILYRAFQSSKNGLIYGSRLRFAHSLVVSLMFKPNAPLSKRIRTIIRSTKKHAELLFCFAGVYKLLLLFLNNYVSRGNVKILKQKGLKELISGAIGGFLIYSGVSTHFDGAIAQQITLYCGARVMLALGKLVAKKLGQRNLNGSIQQKQTQLKIENYSWIVYSTLTWGIVMYLFETNADLLQYSLRNSMEYIYQNDNSSQLSSLARFFS